MKTFQSCFKNGSWTKPLDPNLNSREFAVFVFFSRECLKTSDPGLKAQFQAAFNQIKQSFDQSHIIGCSTAGEILDTELLDASITIIGFSIEGVTFKSAKLEMHNSASSRRAGEDLGNLLRDPALKCVVVVTDGMTLDGTGFVSGLNAAIGANIPIVGGLAGDGTNFESTVCLYQGDFVHGGCVLGIGIYGDNVTIQTAARGGWDRFGPKRTVTRSIGNVVYEIDHEPALHMYKRYLGKKAVDLPASALYFPLAIGSESHPGTELTRTILGVCETENSVTFAGSVPEGSIVTMMHCVLDHLIDGAAETGKILGDAVNESTPGLVLLFSCVGRRLVLGDRIEEELEAIRELLPKSVLMGGFYSYGEICPTIAGNSSDLHNETMTGVFISEKIVA